MGERVRGIEKVRHEKKKKEKRSKALLQGDHSVCRNEPEHPSTSDI